MADYLVKILTAGLDVLDRGELSALTRRERARGRELLADGVIRSLWRVPGQRYNYGIWSAPDIDALDAAFATLPIFPYVEFEVTRVEDHPVITGDDSDLADPADPADPVDPA